MKTFSTINREVESITEAPCWLAAVLIIKHSWTTKPLPLTLIRCIRPRGPADVMHVGLHDVYTISASIHHAALHLCLLPAALHHNLLLRLHLQSNPCHQPVSVCVFISVCVCARACSSTSITCCVCVCERAVGKVNGSVHSHSRRHDSVKNIQRLQNEWKMAKIALIVILLYVISWSPYSCVALTAFAG